MTKTIVDIDPTVDPVPPGRVLISVSITIDDQQYNLEQTIDESAFTLKFDETWDELGKIIKGEMNI